MCIPWQSLLVEMIRAKAKFGINSSFQITVVFHSVFPTIDVARMNTTVQLLEGDAKSKQTVQH